MIAARCVPIAIGTDIGGSVRIPAGFCGVYGFKPTQTRCSTRGVSNCLKKNFSIKKHLHATIGPIGGSVDDLIVSSKVVFDENLHHYDPIMAPSPWRDQDFQSVINNRKGCKIGIQNEFHWMPVSDTVRRAMKIAEDALRRLGYQIV